MHTLRYFCFCFMKLSKKGDHRAFQVSLHTFHKFFTKLGHSVFFAYICTIQRQQADMVKQNIDQLMDSGMLKMDMKEAVSYEVQPDGWVKSIKAEITNDAMGQKIKTTTTVTLK